MINEKEAKTWKIRVFTFFISFMYKCVGNFSKYMVRMMSRFERHDTESQRQITLIKKKWKVKQSSDPLVRLFVLRGPALRCPHLHSQFFPRRRLDPKAKLHDGNDPRQAAHLPSMAQHRLRHRHDPKIPRDSLHPKLQNLRRQVRLLRSPHRSRSAHHQRPRLQPSRSQQNHGSFQIQNFSALQLPLQDSEQNSVLHGNHALRLGLLDALLADHLLGHQSTHFSDFSPI